jgi:hypothetical protein
MTAQTMQKTSSTPVWFVVVVTLIALLLGWGLKSFTEGGTRAVSEGGISASVPAGWLVNANDAGPLTSGQTETGLVFSSWDPLDPGTRYYVSLLPGGAQDDLAAAAAIRNLSRAQHLTAYRVLERTPVTLKGRAGYRVSFAYVNASDPGEAPVVYEGVDYYFADGDQIIVATLETTGAVEESLDAFRDFAAGAGNGE